MTTAPKQVQQAPALVPRGDGDDAVRLYVDAAVDLGGHFLVSGWRAEALSLEVWSGEQSLPCEFLSRDRDDVARQLTLESGADLGFIIIGEKSADTAVSLAWAVPGAPRIPIILEALSDPEAKVPVPAGFRRAIMRHLPAFSEAWQRLATESKGRAPQKGEVAANLEGGLAATGATAAIVSGWCAPTDHQAELWLESPSGQVIDLAKAWHRERPDVVKSLADRPSGGNQPTGFVVGVDAAPGERVWLRMLAEDSIVDVRALTVAALPADPRAAAEHVLGLSPPGMNRFSDFVEDLALPVLSGLLEDRQRSWETAEVREWSLGHTPDRPSVSIIVPLYGRIDFIEHQLLEFARDDWFREHAELIYVVDDPAIIDRCLSVSSGLNALYGVPFRVLWGGVNRGFSGANNLGAAHARGQHLLFLNSDVFPRKPGWLEHLSQTLDSDPSRGAVAPRLLFADGSIQHAGMVFRRRPDLGVWVNHHPHMGLEPDLDPARTETDVPAVTGACLLVGRGDFEEVGGWDTGYLIGDFEDSDLCLKLRAIGKKITYCPDVELTHLERQSFEGLGGPAFRQKVVIYNAVRHQSRWSDALGEWEHVE